MYEGLLLCLKMNHPKRNIFSFLAVSDELHFLHKLNFSNCHVKIIKFQNMLRIDYLGELSTTKIGEKISLDKHISDYPKFLLIISLDILNF